MVSEAQDLYVTRDLMESGALVCAGAKLLRLQPEDNFFWFVFDGKTQCEILSNQFWSYELQLSAKAYSDSIRSLKDRIFAQEYRRPEHGR